MTAPNADARAVRPGPFSMGLSPCVLYVYVDTLQSTRRSENERSFFQLYDYAPSLFPVFLGLELCRPEHCV